MVPRVLGVVHRVLGLLPGVLGVIPRVLGVFVMPGAKRLSGTLHLAKLTTRLTALERVGRPVGITRVGPFPKAVIPRVQSVQCVGW